MTKPIAPDLLAWGHGPSAICGVGKAFVTQSAPNRLLVAAVIDANVERCAKHRGYERHAGTMLWIPSAAQYSSTGAKLEQLLCGDDAGQEWEDLEL